MNIPTQLSPWPLFLLASLAVLLSPGPNVLYVIARSIDQGRKAGVVSVLGLETGTLLQVAAAALGISAIGMSSALMFDVVKYLGAAYLLYLGICKALERGALAESKATTPASLRRVFGQGVLVGVVNPKTGLFFLAFLPQFVDPLRGNLALQTALLGLAFIALATTTDGSYALLAASLGQRLRRSKHFAIGQRCFAATMFIALGVSAALTERA
jgi:threonine/homoserine/homoserine lactone efflux protein